ncbi:alpha-mannosidase [Paenibacillus motobuensis]|uniref:Alpha-mannosidase n=1 Tax=Paenibacillus motobuensis TaxID=295324 RepID=A0ABN0XV80_9BACL
MKKVYIISHSHWDREWYLPYEQHHMRLIQLVDDLLELCENDPEFKSFHLDGQTIILDDYVQVRPEKKPLLEKYIREGRLKIGPFYILQDDFLISSEANTRNMLIGFEESKKWGTPVKLGYFPDTFGNMGQTPQMMREAGLDVAAFGRGVKPTGFNNVVINDEKYASQYSEMWWEGPDGSKILGLLFANWYSNGNEIPVNRKEAKLFWDRKLDEAVRYASTDHLLMMNGCDHQPVQKDLSAAIRVANELYPDVEFIHSNFEEYIDALRADLPQNLSTVTGELTSQETSGWYTLANTASARIYLKQMNTEVQRQLENIAEPLATMAYPSAGQYPHDMLRYAWKTLMQNHPHDSICGCSVDEVHREMVTRFKKAKELGKFVADKAAEALLAQIDTSAFPEGSKPFVIFNTAGSAKTGVAEITLEWMRKPFTEGVPSRLYYKLKETKLPELRVVNIRGEKIAAEIIDEGVAFGYDLPKDKFRQPYMGRYVKVRIFMEQMPAMGWKSFALMEGASMDLQSGNPIVRKQGYVLKNEFLKVSIQEDGSLKVLNKETGKRYKGLMVFEDTGDIGNEYIFKQPEGDKAILSLCKKATVSIQTANAFVGEVLVEQELEIPISADERLEEEKKAVIEFRHRKAQRSKETAILKLATKITLLKGSRQLQFETNFNNQMKDHRLRVLFPTGIETSYHEAESIYEVVQRPNKVDRAWKNPTNPQHQHSFINVHNDEHGVTVANFGLNEYEVLQQGTIALTLLRSVGELGDWGYFPTPEAQCLGENRVRFALSFHGDETDKLRTFHEAMNFQIPFSCYQTSSKHAGHYPAEHQFMKIEGDAFALTAFKRKEHSDELVTRGFNMTGTEQPVSLSIAGLTPHRCNLLEEPVAAEVAKTIKPAEIISYCWSK